MISWSGSSKEELGFGMSFIRPEQTWTKSLGQILGNFFKHTLHTRGSDCSVFQKVPIKAHMMMSGELSQLPKDFKAAPRDMSWIGLPGDMHQKCMRVEAL